MNQIVQKLCSGTWSRAYRQMGAHPGRSGGRDGWRFRVWAPNASDVSLAGDFSGWQPLPDGAKGRPVGVLRAGGEGV